MKSLDQDLSALREAWKVGKQSGQPAPANQEQIRAQAVQRLEEIARTKSASS